MTGLIVVGAVVALAAGYVTWGAVAAAGQQAKWESVAGSASDAGSIWSVVDVAEDMSSVRIASVGAPTCTSSEEESLASKIISQFVDLGLGEVPYSITGPIAEKQAREQCARQKQADFGAAVALSQVIVVELLTAIEAPDRVAGQLDGLRGLDGTREISARTAAGDVTVHARYDGSNGLDVVISRNAVGIDWSAPLRAVGL